MESQLAINDSESGSEYSESGSEYSESDSESNNEEDLPIEIDGMIESSSESDIDNCDYERQRLQKLSHHRNLLRSLGVPIVNPKKRIKLMNEYETQVKEKLQSKPKRKRTRKINSTTGEVSNKSRRSSTRITEHMRAKPEVSKPRRFSRRLLGQSLENDSGSNKENKPVSEEDEGDDDIDTRLLTEQEINTEIFANIFSDKKYDSTINILDCDFNRDQIKSFRMDPIKRVSHYRIQSMAIHPSLCKSLVLAGSTEGSLSILDSDLDSENAVVTFEPHRRALNCISISKFNNEKIYTTSHDGTIICADLIYATNIDERDRHLTWHDELMESVLLVAHGNGTAGIIDTRAGKNLQRKITCYPRSCRTVQSYSENICLVSSGSAGKSADPLHKLGKEKSKGLTSAFLSDNKNKVIVTSNDDKIQIYSFVGSSPADLKFRETRSVPHNNHTGRWLSVFKALWYPGRDDAWLVGSLLSPRRVQVYDVNGELIAGLRSEEMTTVLPVIAIHPVKPFLAGGNSTGKIHVFRPPKS